MTAETIKEFTALLKVIDERHTRPPTSPAMKDYRRGYIDALLDLRIHLKQILEQDLICPTPPSTPVSATNSPEKSSPTESP